MITFTHKTTHLGKGLIRADCQAHASKTGRVIMGHFVVFRQSGSDLAFRIKIRKILEEYLTAHISKRFERPNLKYWLKLADLKLGNFFTKKINRRRKA